MPIRFPTKCDYRQMRSPLEKGLLARDYLTWAFIPLQRIVPLRGTLSCAFGAALLQGPARGDYLTWAFMPLRRIVPLRGTPSCAFGAALLQGPTREGLSHMGFYTAAANCASSRHSILRLWRGPSPRACTRGLSHMGFHAAATNCASSRHSILRLWRGPSPRAYAREEYSSP